MSENMSQPKVSIIIPVYNAEAYIERCAASLFGQTLNELEYIFVDDCSSDRSIEILSNVLELYPERKDSVKIIKMQANSGIAAVRKFAISFATGEYVVHCDSDDWVDKSAYEECYEFAISNDYDIVFFDYDRTDGTIHKINQRNIPNEKSALIGSLISGKVMGSMWRGIVRRKLYDNVEVYPQHNMCEDLVLFIQLVNNAKRYGYIQKPYYKYFVSDESLTSVKNKEKAIAIFHHAHANIKLMFEYLQRHNLSEYYVDEIEARKVTTISCLLPYVNSDDVWLLWRSTYNLNFIEIGLNANLSMYLRLMYITLRVIPIMRRFMWLFF